MACNTKHGPAAAIKMYEQITGVKLTQKDWHIIREEARLDSGGTLSREIIDPADARTVAADFYDAAIKSIGFSESDPVARDAFADEFCSQPVTAGTLHTIDQIAQYGLPEAVTSRPRRGSSEKPSASNQPAEEVFFSDVKQELTADGVLVYRSDEALGSMGGASPELRAGQEMLVGLQVGGNDDDSAEGLVSLAVFVNKSAASVHEAAGLMGMDLNQRLYDNGIASVSDGVTGKSLIPRSNFRYKTWRHEEVLAAVAGSIANEHGFAASDVSAVMTAYGDFASVSGYRPAALRERDLRAKDFADGAAGQRDVQVNFGSGDGHHSASFSNAFASVPEIKSLTESVAASRARLAALPLDEAVREYVAIRQIDRTLGQIAKSVDARVSERLHDAGLKDVRGYDSYRTADRTSWDSESLDRKLIPLVASRAGVDSRIAAVVVNDYKSVASVSGFKKRALKSADIDVDDYLSSTPGAFKLKAVEVAAEVA